MIKYKNKETNKMENLTLADFYYLVLINHT